MKRYVLVLNLFLFCFVYITAQDKAYDFRNLFWGSIPDEIIKIEGLPDQIIDVNSKKQIIWINPQYITKKPWLLEYAEENNIPIGANIEKILKEHEEFQFVYDSKYAAGYSSSLMLWIKKSTGLEFGIYSIDIDNCYMDGETDIYLEISEKLEKLYGKPYRITDRLPILHKYWKNGETDIELTLYVSENRSDPSDDLRITYFSK
jgi:hypothetical protein